MAKKEIAIIGVGRFGSSVIQKIKDIPNIEIIAIDTNEKHLKSENNLSKYYVGDASDETFLASLGLDSTDVFVLGIGDNIQASLLIASVIKSQWPEARIIAKAVSTHHERILQQIGIGEIVNPEKAAARRAAIKIINPVLATIGSEDDEVFELEGGVSLVKIVSPSSFHNKKVMKLDIPKGISIVLSYKDGQPKIVDGNTIIEPNDKVVIIGENTKIMVMLQELKVQ